MLLILLMPGGWFGAAGGAPATPVAPPPAPQPVDVPGAGIPMPLASTGALRRQLVEQVQLADQTYCSYREATIYPHSARPIAEQPDQIWPNAPVTELNPMREEGGASNPTVQIQSTQSRVHMAAGESVSFSLRALDEEGNPLALVVTGALAQGMTFRDARPAPQVALQFSEAGAGLLSSQPGLHSAMLTPANTSLAGFDGTIRTRVRYSVAGKSGALNFDVIYSPQLPAVWSGPVREAMEDGSLVFYLPLEVRQAGRYVVHGRIDDARGVALALLTFNELLPAGPAEVRLSMFGKLVHDRRPALPLTLRDVDGYLLRENLDPDRATLARLAGKVHISRSHPLKNFSDAEWHSAERTRYLDELGLDMRRARAALGRFDPAALPAPPCKPPP